MTEYERELSSTMLEKYENKDYAMLDEMWQDFPMELKLEIIYRAQRDGVKHFTSAERFVDEYDQHNGNSEFEAIIASVNKMGFDFGLSQPEIRTLHNYMRIGDYNSKDVFTIELEKLLMLYRRFREYTELNEKYDCLDMTDNRFNFSLLKCDPRRSESRIKFLLELGEGKILEGDNLKGILTMPANRFNLRYQKDVEKKVSEIEVGSLEYSAIAEYINVEPEFAYDKFLETALMAVYGDEKILGIIERKREQLHEEFLRELGSTEETHIPEKVDDEKTPEESEEFVRIYGMPVESRETPERGNGAGTGISNSKLEVFDLQRINDFLAELKKHGIKRIGELETEGGVSAKDKEFVIYQILEIDGWRILEPVGQANNRTYVINGDKPITEIGEIMKTRGRNALVKEGHAIRFNHHRTENKTYDYPTQIQKLKNLALLTRELANKKQLDTSLEQIRQEVTALIDKGEIPEASGYIGMLVKTAEFITRRAETKEENQGEIETKTAVVPHETSSAGTDAGEVDI